MGVSLNGGTPISHPKCWSFLVGKPMVVGETHHFRTPPLDILSNTRFGSIFRKSSRKLDDKIWQSWGFEPCRWNSQRKDEAKHLKDMKPTEKRQDGIVWLSWILLRFYVWNQFSLISCSWSLGFTLLPSVLSAVSLHHPTGNTWDRICPIRLGFCLCVPWNAALDFESS